MRETDIFLLRAKYNLQGNCTPHTHKVFNCFLYIANNLNSYDEKNTLIYKQRNVRTDFQLMNCQDTDTTAW